MATRGRKRKSIKAKQKSTNLNLIEPTSEQYEKNDFERAARAYRKVSPVVSLSRKGVISSLQADALLKYGEIADNCSRSSPKSCCDFSVKGGSSEGPSAKIVYNRNELQRLDRKLGGLADFAAKIAVEWKTINQWAIEQFGGIERSRLNPNGSKTNWIEARPRHVRDGIADLQRAGEILSKAFGA